MSIGVAKLVIRSITGFASVQDLGRPGYRDKGIPVSGAIDKTSHAYVNALVGNSSSEASIEVFGSITLEVIGDTILCVTGGGRLYVDEAEHDTWRPVLIRSGSVVRVEPYYSPLSYIGVSGGIICESVLGSRSTYILGGFGCLARGLRNNDVLETPSTDVDSIWSKVKDLTPVFNPREYYRFGEELVLHATRGVHQDLVYDLDMLFKNKYTVSFECDRMGYRLEGPPLESTKSLGRLPSTPVDRGYVQIPPDGKPIVLMVDAQTMGGYAVALHVLHRDLDLLAHRQYGDEVLFKEITDREAEERMAEYLSLIEKPVLGNY